MLYTALTKKALKLCFDAHKNQVDKGGLPYVFHPFHLAEQMTSEFETIAALLHDIIEDTHHTLKDLSIMGFPAEVVEAIRLLTHKKELPFLEYIKNLKNNSIAKAVKLADLRHNCDLTRLEKIDEIALKRIEKYKQAISILTE